MTGGEKENAFNNLYGHLIMDYSIDYCIIVHGFFQKMTLKMQKFFITFSDTY